MVALAVTESTQVANINAVPPVALDTLDLHGRIRIAWFDWMNGLVAGDAEGVIQLVKLPAGRIRILGKLSEFYSQSTQGSQTYDIGWLEHTDLNGDTVDADEDGLNDETDVDTVGAFNFCIVQVATGSTKELESQEGITITLTASAILKASEGIYGWIAYVLD